MRVSVPNIPRSLLDSSHPTTGQSLLEAVDRVASFLAPGNATVLTGAGVSVDSGIRAYRGKDGRYANPNYKFVDDQLTHENQLTYHELVDETERGHAFRQRYWFRSYLGYPPVRDARPNPTHIAFAALQHASLVARLITQNVDGLHHKTIRGIWDEDRIDRSILELHGTLHKVSCKYGHVTTRDTFQDWLSAVNPYLADFVAEMEASGRRPRTNPDGDVELDGVSYDDFVLPECPTCLSENRRITLHKPEVIFFGESVRNDVKNRAYEDIDRARGLLVVGTSLATHSAFRLVQRAVDSRKPVLVLNMGPTRADVFNEIASINFRSGVVMPEVVKVLLGHDVSDNPFARKLIAKDVGITPPEGDLAPGGTG